jgi:hypothetical protein
MGFVSTAAETALIGVADSNQPAAVLALNQLQGRTRWSGRSPRWSRWSRWRSTHRPGLALAGGGRVGRRRDLSARFGLQRRGQSPEGNASLIGVGIFVVWMLVLSTGLWRTASQRTSPRP